MGVHFPAGRIAEAGASSVEKTHGKSSGLLSKNGSQYPAVNTCTNTKFTLNKRTHATSDTHIYGQTNADGEPHCTSTGNSFAWEGHERTYARGTSEEKEMHTALGERGKALETIGHISQFVTSN